MFSNSEFVRQNHVLKHVSSITADRTAVVYLPVNIPKNIENNLVEEQDIREKFRLKRPYIFYPTQIRPYKNITVLVRALSILKQKNLDVELVLTGNPADVPEVEMEIARLNIKDQIVCLPPVTEYELLSLYRYAAVAAVPTLFEGGFPWQACEALFMDAPLVLSKISVVEERIEFTGMSPENCGVILFNPESPAECAVGIAKAISNRKDTLFSQKEFKTRLLSYSWFDAVEKYYNIFFGNHPQPES
jgi:glycosyltransferase involved in cell wall biosynthesis